MNIKNWKSDDCGMVESHTKINIPWLGVSVETWFDIETDQNWWTSKQVATYENILNLSGNSKKEFISRLETVYSMELRKGRIEASEFENILETIEWSKSHLCIPQLYESENEYALLLPETRWKLVNSDYTLELEFLYTNGKIELVQEMSGLWSRVEWFEDYLKRKTTYNNS